MKTPTATHAKRRLPPNQFQVCAMFFYVPSYRTFFRACIACSLKLTVAFITRDLFLFQFFFAFSHFCVEKCEFDWQKCDKSLFQRPKLILLQNNQNSQLGNDFKTIKYLWTIHMHFIKIIFVSHMLVIPMELEVQIQKIIY